MLSDREAEDGFVSGLVAARAAGEEGLGVVMPMYWTPTCWRSKEGFFGLTAKMTTKTMARTRSAKKENKRKRQQQQPFKEAEDEAEDDNGVVG